MTNRTKVREGSKIRAKQTAKTALSQKLKTWDQFFEMMKTTNVPEEFLLDREDLVPQKRE